MNIDFSSVKNIIFDLGNVVIDIDFNITFQAFADMMEEPLENINRYLRESNINYRYETGQISEEELIKEVQERSKVQLSAQQIKDAWNALLLEMPNERIELIQKLGEKYQTFVLSNTNPTHIDKVNEQLKSNTGISDLVEVFNNTVYYSHHIGMHKPEHRIYEHVIKESNLVANETLFIDDKEENVIGAREVGLQAIHLVKPYTILDILKDA